MAKLKNIAIVILLLAVVGLSAFVYMTTDFASGSTVTSQLVEEQIASLGELCTVRYNYTNVVAWKDDIRVYNITLPFTTKSFMLLYNGYIKAGVDLTDVTITLGQGQDVHVLLPAPTITDNVLNEEDVYLYDERSALFNRLVYSDLYQVLPAEKEQMAHQAIERGLLEQAKTNAATLVTALLNNLGFSEVTISWKQGR